MDQDQKPPVTTAPSQPTSGHNAAVPPTPPSVSSPTNGASAGGSSDVDQHKLWAILGYVLPILFFVPLLSDAKQNPFAKYHANQQLNLLIFWVITSMVLPLIPFIGWVLMPICYIAGVVFLIMGVINASQGQQKPLPLIGKFELIK